MTTGEPWADLLILIAMMVLAFEMSRRLTMRFLDWWWFND